ncbi:Imidazolonepropionase [Candidatus Lokiarchaeum ossiferum]|uniref:Imidazolonepropionase n=1 Tax=Candidatus Lokiarchaeum ossiferum TaxID=2951803 RepID=A0ABY6HMX3_9ARCH|nr:Imidazolonepropionase [Candidatus Lokiarchaeum sp. B-35]
MTQKTLIGPFKQILTMQNLPVKGSIKDEALEIIENGAILIEDEKIHSLLTEEQFQTERKNYKKKRGDNIFFEITKDSILIPGFIDSHTHMCYAGSRADDYARRIAGESYLEIAKKGGGILSTVKCTREATNKELMQLLFERGLHHLKRGITTCEVKSGYGLDLENELKMLRVIKQAKESRYLIPDLVSTCLAAHVKPKEFESHEDYLDFIVKEILPKIIEEGLSKRVDIFIEEGAFDSEMSLKFLEQAKALGFEITVHADQFSTGGAKVAAKVGAISADHLEASQEEDIIAMKEGNVIATVLPGASMGLGVGYAPARKILDNGLCLVIASDWNPGSAPMGDLLIQAAVLGANQKLSIAETLSAITNRAALALNLNDRGELSEGKLADMLAFPCSKYQEIFYNQGILRPSLIWKQGTRII